ncbi:MAG: NB-ARC domain-containing protein [Caldilineaceae bacterium]
MSAQGRPTAPTVAAVRSALKQWHRESNGASPLGALYLYRKTMRELERNPRYVTNHLLFQAMEELQQRYDQDVKLLQLHYLDQWPINHLANHFNVAESTIYAMQRKSIKRLAAILQDLENVTYATHKQQLQQRLEAPTYAELVGVKSRMKQLLSKLSPGQAPWLVAIEGLGGVGKTSLADALLRHVIDEQHYDEIGWVSARQQRFNLGGLITEVAAPALTTTALIEALVRQLMPELTQTLILGETELLGRLRKRLKQTPHLVVIDNLETLTDLATLLPTLQDLANPSKFLLTSRVGLYTTPNVYHYPVGELEEEDALRLIRQEAVTSNLPALAASTANELRPIYATVGGNPLALRLVVGQSHIYPLDSILKHLRAAQGQSAENLYTYIYWRAWESLDPMSQDVLLIMPLVNPQGDELEVIAEAGAMAIEEVRLALNHLVTLKLVDARGGLQERRYSIHGLTRTFLHEQVLRWKL